MPWSRPRYAPDRNFDLSSFELVLECKALIDVTGYTLVALVIFEFGPSESHFRF